MGAEPISYAYLSTCYFGKCGFFLIRKGESVYQRAMTKRKTIVINETRDILW